MIGRSGRRILVICLAAASASAGCGHCSRGRRQPEIGVDPPFEARSPEKPRWNLAGKFDADAVRAGAAVRLKTPVPSPALDAEWCERRAAEVAGAAALAERESEIGQGPLAAATAPWRRKKDRLDSLLLEQLKADARAKQCAAALEAFHRLAEVQARRALLAEALDELEAAFADAENLNRSGFTADVEPLRIRRDEGWQAALRLEGMAVGLSAQLRAALKLGPECSEGELVAAGDWNRIPAESADPRTSICEHPELRFLGELEGSIDGDTLPVVRRYLRSIQPLLGASAAIPGLSLIERIVLRWCPPPAVKREIETRRRQIESYRRDKADQLAAEAIARDAECRALRLRIALEVGSLEQSRSSLRQVEDRRNKGVASRAELALARLAAADAEQRLIGLVADLNVANVKLRQALGRLPANAPGETCALPARIGRGLLCGNRFGAPPTALLTPVEPVELIDE